MMRRIMQIKKNLLSALVDEACKISIIPILHIIGKPNSIIVFLSIQNISKFLTNIPPPRLSLKLWPISWHSFLILTVACYCQIFLKKDNMHASSNMFWVFLHFFWTIQFCQKFSYFELDSQLFSVNCCPSTLISRQIYIDQPLFRANIPSNRCYMTPSSKFAQDRLVMKN